MKIISPKPLRCAIYTRKSTEHNLDLAFNSLDAQREACEAYVKSQAHEGWMLVPERFDDGGISGASLDRPALQLLLQGVGDGCVDVIVVYKVDRLTRSLADFAKLVELFDAHEASFVSVTQSFNTTSSMGRLTLNVLLSFAQFEREVIGERVRDKIAASKRKGIWVGGPILLGYRSLGKKLFVVPEEAEAVRTIFRRYLALGSLGMLIDDLARLGVKPRNSKFGRFMVGPLAHILKNRFNIGEVAYRGEVHQGEHPPIVGKALFLAVQAKLRDRAVDRRVRRSHSPSFLSGLIYDDRDNRMSPSHANKRGVRYRYYVSQAVLQNRKAQAGSITRASAPDVEELVIAAVRHQFGASPELSDRDLVALHVERIVLRPRHIEVTILDPDPASHELAEAGDESRADAQDEHTKGKSQSPTVLTIPWVPAGAKARKGIAFELAGDQSLDPAARDTVLTAIARARCWMDDLVEGRVSSFEEIAKSEGKVERHIRHLAPLAYLSPRIVEAIANGTAPAGLTVTSLARALPHSWAGQEQKLGIS